ncbi:MAG: hypothetical protein HOK30_04885 [Rhodospirillaceae bacterium]|nr:hypothetical protein [Rhodospirillaceae bacterium]
MKNLNQSNIDGTRATQAAKGMMRDPEAAQFSSVEPTQRMPRPTPREEDPPGADRLGLTPEEIKQFREKGYLIKRGLIPKEGFSPILDLWWQQPPVLSANISSDDPTSWVSPGDRWPAENRWGLAENWMGGGKWPEPEDERTGAVTGERVGRLPYKLTLDRSNNVWRWHGIGHDPDFVDATSAHPRMLHMIEALLGGPVKRPWRNRGIYAVFPRDPDGPKSKLGPHMDQSMTELQAVTYLDDVGPQSGGFTIYPTSSRLLYPTSQQALNWMPTEASQDVVDHVTANIEPIEFTGQAGDVIFCHGWTVHSAGVQESKRIRMAVIQDFNRARERSHMRWTAAGLGGGPRVNCDMDGAFVFTTDGQDGDPADGGREVTNQWIMDSNEFVLDQQAPFDDLFADWNLGQRPVMGNVVAEPPWWLKYNLPMLPTRDMPRGTGGMPALPISEVAEYEGEGVWRVTSRANDWMQD